MSRAETQNKI